MGTVVKKGIDVSDNQGVIDWGAVKAAGVEFAILRSVRRSGRADLQFENNVRGCLEQGIPFDVYKYSYALSEADAGIEMRQVYGLLDTYGIHCRIWFDAEWKGQRELGKKLSLPSSGRQRKRWRIGDIPSGSTATWTGTCP